LDGGGFHGGGWWFVKFTTKALATDRVTSGISNQFAGGYKVGTVTSAGVEDHAADDENDAFLWCRKAMHLAESGGKTWDSRDVTGWGAGG